MKRVGLLGGSFNPPHDGHLYIAQYAYEELGLDEVWMLVTPGNPHKAPAAYAPLIHRKAMCDILGEGHPWLKPTTIEQGFSSTYTADTLSLISEMHPGNRFIWIMGADNFASFHTWDRLAHKLDDELSPDWRYIMHNFPMVVLTRPGDPRNGQPSLASEYGEPFRLHEPRQLGIDKNGWCFMPNSPLDVSSTQILKDIREGKDLIPGLRPAIQQYAHKHGMYGMNQSFNAMAIAPQRMPAPYVPLEFMTILVRAGNLFKSIAAASPYDVLEYFDACMKKSHDKGDFNKREDVPGEIADCLISLQWLATAQEIQLPYNHGVETQETVSLWCDTHFPGQDLREKVLAYVEELAELLVCQGLTADKANLVLKTVLDDPFTEDLTVSYEKNLAALNAGAQKVETPLARILDEKMAHNRERTPAQSADRLHAKQETLRRIP